MDNNEETSFKHISQTQSFFILESGNYLYIRYSNDGGETFTSNNGLDIGAYEGIYISDKEGVTLTPDLFTWNKRESPYESATEPSNKYDNMLWLDISQEPNILKFWDGNGWVEIGNFSGDVSNLRKEINEANTSITQNKDSINALVENTTIMVDGSEVAINKYVNDLKITVDGLTQTVSKRDGNNILRDSIGCFNDGAWVGDYNIDSTVETRSMNMYGYALLLRNGTLYQKNNVANGIYTLSFTYKKLISLAYVTLNVNDEVFYLSNTDYTQFSHTFNVTSGIIEITFESDTNNAMPIINLMLNRGSDALEWSLNPNETWSDTVKIGRGVRISSSGTDVEFVAYADIIGFQDKQGNYITTFDDNGIVTNEIIVKNRATIVRLHYQIINGQTVMNVMAEEV